MRINNANCTYNLEALESRSLEKDFQGPMDPHRSYRGRPYRTYMLLGQGRQQRPCPQAQHFLAPAAKKVPDVWGGPCTPGCCWMEW